MSERASGQHPHDGEADPLSEMIRLAERWSHVWAWESLFDHERGVRSHLEQRDKFSDARRCRIRAASRRGEEFVPDESTDRIIRQEQEAADLYTYARNQLLAELQKLFSFVKEHVPDLLGDVPRRELWPQPSGAGEAREAARQAGVLQGKLLARVVSVRATVPVTSAPDMEPIAGVKAEPVEYTVGRVRAKWTGNRYEIEVCTAGGMWEPVSLEPGQAAAVALLARNPNGLTPTEMDAAEEGATDRARQLRAALNKSPALKQAIGCRGRGFRGDPKVHFILPAAARQTA